MASKSGFLGSNESRKSNDSGESPKSAVDGHRWDERIERIRSVRFDERRILLVDDSPDNQKLFQRILSSAGAVIDLASNGAEAVDLVSKSSTYDAIIMDVRMPIVDGYEATRLIRELGYRGPIVALTAHANPGEKERCLSAGCSSFYLKPIDRLSLLTAVDQALSSSTNL